MRRITLLFGLISTMALTGGCESKSEIKPLFEKKTLSELHGDGEAMTFTVKVPLAQDMVGSYHVSEIMEDETLNEKESSWWRKLANGVKYGIYDMAVNAGISNRIKYSFDYELPEIDSEYIKSVKVKRIFFALENCRAEDEECIMREKKRPVTFKFLDEFFMNLSIVRPGEEADLENQDFIMETKDFKAASSRAFGGPTAKGYFDLVDEDGKIADSVFRDVNLTRFKNSRGYRKDENIKKELSKTFLLRLRRDMSKSDRIELMKHFRNDAYKNIVKDFSLVGDNIYLELTELSLRKRFFQILAQAAGSVENLGIDSFEECSQLNCADLDTNGANLVPMLERSNRIRFDTYLALEKLEMNDFRYNGYVELEVKLDLGI